MKVWQRVRPKILMNKRKLSNDNLYTAQAKSQAKVIDFKWVKNGRRKPNWSTLSADHINFPVADLEMLAHIEQQKIPVEAADVFAKNACLFSESRIIVKGRHDTVWYAGYVFVLL